ncbi:hypothetical protein ACJX0J_015245 [Zea mays]
MRRYMVFILHLAKNYSTFCHILFKIYYITGQMFMILIVKYSSKRSDKVEIEIKDMTAQEMYLLKHNLFFSARAAQHPAEQDITDWSTMENSQNSSNNVYISLLGVSGSSFRWLFLAQHIRIQGELLQLINETILHVFVVDLCPLNRIMPTTRMTKIRTISLISEEVAIGIGDIAFDI